MFTETEEFNREFRGKRKRLYGDCKEEKLTFFLFIHGFVC